MIEVERVRFCGAKAVTFRQDRHPARPVRASTLHANTLLVEAELAVVVEIVVLMAFNKRHKLIISFKVPIHVLPLVDCITKALRNALLALELDENILLLRRFEQINHYSASHELTRLVAFLVGKDHDVTAVIWL